MPVLGKTFLEVASLDVMKTTCVATVVTGVDTALGIDLEPKGIAAPLGKDFVAALLRVVSPDQLADRINRLVLAAIAPDMSRDSAALGSVQPAIGSPSQTVRDRVRVFHAEAFQVDLWISVRYVVMVSVRVK